MKIFILSRYVPPEKGAAVNRIMSFLKTWEKNSHNVYLITPEHSFLHNGKKHNKVIMFKNIIDLIKIYKKERPDLTIVTSPPQEILFFVIVLKILLDVRYVVDIRDPSFIKSRQKNTKIYFQHLYRYLLENIACNMADLIFTVSPVLKNYISNFTNSVPIKVIPNGVSSIFFENYEKITMKRNFYIARETNKLKLVYHGIVGGRRIDEFIIQLSYYKNILNDIDVELILLKDKYSINTYNKLMKLTKRLELDKIVHFDYNLALDKLSKKLLKKDIGIIMLPDSLDEQYTYPVKFYEYYGSGLNVLALCSNKSPLAKIIKKFNAGYSAENWKDFFQILIGIKNGRVPLKKIDVLSTKGEFDRSLIAARALNELKIHFKF